jgi:hypothetical protein
MIPESSSRRNTLAWSLFLRSARRGVSYSSIAPSRIIPMLSWDEQLREASLKNRRKTTSFSSKVAKHASLFRFVVVGNRDGSPDWPFAGCCGCHVRPWVSEDAVK